MFEGTNKWVSSGCYTKHDAELWAESKIRNKTGYIQTPVHKGFKMTRRKGRNIQVMFKGTDKWVSSGYDDEINATIWAEAQLREIKRDELTLEEFSEGFYTRTDEMSFRASCIRKGKEYQDDYFFAMDGRLQNYILPVFGDVCLNNLNRVTIERWYVSLKSFRTKGDLSPSTKNKIFECLNNIMEEAEINGHIDSNPCKKILKIVERSNPRLPITRDEIAILFPENDKQVEWVWGNLKWAVYFSIMRCTGFRPGEIAGMKRENYFPDLGGVFTTQAVCSWKREVVERIKTTRVGKRYKVGLLNSQCCRLLDQYLLSLPLEQEYLFLSKGRLITTYTSNKHFITYAERAGVRLEGRTEYSLRHSFQTAISGELEKNQILELMGHTKYCESYDHREGRRKLEQLQGIRGRVDTLV
jgi:integrase